MFRIGQGFDLHKLVEGRKLIIGGVEIQYSKGLLGHSDADVLIHSIIDALFGALSLGDIGTHFPDNDPQYKNIDSSVLLKEAIKLVKEKGYKINNIDNTILAQEPKMKSYIPLMQKRLAELLDIEENQISIKAKTMEEQDSIGERKAIATQSVVLLIKE
ncbi:MAG: 2-C-methyl-D-erythritol 2,4-cyclodiphosphate synthase [Candidatus Gastranaerophilales bacterium]|nr:2-C-methyl-D-erythritol 2,4-cyclodiphosphate synthase [Candidatus Gastranaerophilales bacterium]